MLPSGAVLVVGTGQSGCQIAEELHESGRQVYLSRSSCGRAPRRYRRKDSPWWISRLGFFDRTLDQLPSPTAKFACNPHVSGNHGGHDINLRQFARQGMILLGHVQAAQGKQMILAPDLEANLASALARVSSRSGARMICLPWAACPCPGSIIPCLANWRRLMSGPPLLP